MLKRLALIGCLVAMLACTGCQQATLQIYILDDCIWWMPATETEYTVRVDGKPVAAGDGYVRLDRAADTTYSVEAVSAGVRSESGKRVRYADVALTRVNSLTKFLRYVEIPDETDTWAQQNNCDFRLTTSVDLDFSAALPDGRYAVAAGVSRLRISTGVSRVARLTFLLEPRQDSLVIELNNAAVIGMDDSPVIVATDRLSDRPNVVFRLTGANTLTGGRNTYVGVLGQDGTEDKPAGGTGGDGTDGCAAIVSPVTLFNGNGSVTVVGGRGSAGGDGGDSIGVEGGYGGDGGDGGNALEGTLLFADLADGGTVDLSGGVGGKGGKQGDGFVNMGHDGTPGRLGQSFAGQRIILSGTVNG